VDICLRYNYKGEKMKTRIEWLEMQVRQEQYPQYQEAGRASEVAVEILNRPGEQFRANGGVMIRVTEGYYLVGVDQSGITDFWKAFGELQ
jgi:hypothetical protein